MQASSRRIGKDAFLEQRLPVAKGALADAVVRHRA
jgi:hypothetical protein